MMKKSKERVNKISTVLQIDRKRGKSQKVSKTLSGKAKHLQGVDLIQIYKYVEIMPIHNRKEMKDWKNRLNRKIKEMLKHDDPRIGCFNYPIHVYFKSHLTNESWLKKHVVLGLRIRNYLLDKGQFMHYIYK